MSKRSENIVQRTAAELRARRQRSGTSVDWKAAAKKALPSGRDPDDAMEEVDWATTELPASRRKQHTTIRLDAEMLDWFRAQGRGYQTKINAILLGYFEQHTPERWLVIFDLPYTVVDLLVMMTAASFYSPNG